MSKVQKIENNYKKPLLTPKNTGYVAAVGFLMTTATAFSKNQPIRKSHKILACLTGLLTLLHIGLVEYLHHKYKKM